MVTRFMADSLWNGRKYRLLIVLDDYNREILAIDTYTSIPLLSVIRMLEQVNAVRGLPEMIRVDNGPEFISQKLDYWCKDNKKHVVFIQPGKPSQNGYVERFNGSVRNELLNAQSGMKKPNISPTDDSLLELQEYAYRIINLDNRMNSVERRQNFEQFLSLFTELEDYA